MSVPDGVQRTNDGASTEPEPRSVSASPATRSADNALVARNALYLTIGQALTVPIAIILNGVSGRYLGAVDFGYIYLAGTMCGFGLLAIEWGQQGAIPALVTRNRGGAGVLVGTSIAWRLLVSAAVYCMLSAGSLWIGHPAEFQWPLALTLVMVTLNSVGGAFKDTIRGFERTDVPALAHVGQQVLALAFVVPVLMLGGKLRAALVAQIIVSAITLLVLWRAVRSLGIGSISAERRSLKPLLSAGTPFVFFDLVMLLQPNIDALFLSKMAPPEVMGWFGVSRRLIGLLLFPATALIGALYPTLCRLYSTDREGFLRVARGALQGVALLVIPISVGCALYADIGVSFFSREKFGAAEINLRIYSVFLFLVYFSMPLGTCILASGKQRIWSAVQALCILVSLVADPLLIPYFQEHYGNGSLGLSVAAVISEVLVTAWGIALAPKGLFDRELGRTMLLTFLAGAVMVGIALALRGLSSFLAAPFAVLGYALTLWLTGGIDKSHIELLPGYKRFSRRR